jgi:hypothetical protein
VLEHLILKAGINRLIFRTRKIKPLRTLLHLNKNTIAKALVAALNADGMEHVFWA